MRSFSQYILPLTLFLSELRELCLAKKKPEELFSDTLRYILTRLVMVLVCKTNGLQSIRDQVAN